MFLTLEDPNAKIKGSRDPLGAQPIWASFGRHVVTNLTMQTNSARGFTILLLARYLTERLIAEGRLGTGGQRWMRSCDSSRAGAYARNVGHGVSSNIRGIDRVQSKVADSSGKVPISANPDGFILIDQKVNGLWGLFSVSARISGLISDGPVGVTPDTRAFVERAYLPTLRSGLDDLLHLVERGGQLDTATPDAAFTALSSVLAESFTAEERTFYGAYLRDAIHVRHDSESLRGRQKRLCELLVENVDQNTAIGREDMVRLCEAARSVDEGLAYQLDRIARLEAVLAPAMSLFDFVLNGHGRELGDLAEELVDRWGHSVPFIDATINADLLSEVCSASSETVKGCFARCQGSLSGGNYAEALDALLAWHEEVMRRRGGAAWVLVAEDKTLDVRYRGAGQTLPSGDELSTLWRNGYFIAPLNAVIRQLDRAV